MNFSDNEDLIRTQNHLIAALFRLGTALTYDRAGLPCHHEVTLTRELILDALKTINDYRREMP